MSKAIELLKKCIIEAGKGSCPCLPEGSFRIIRKDYYDQALAELEKQPEQPAQPPAVALAKELRDFGIQLLTIGCLDKNQGKRLCELIAEACRCLDQKPEQTEFTKMLRSIIADSEERSVRPVVQCLQEQAEKACDKLDQQAEEMERLKEENRWIPAEYMPVNLANMPTEVAWKTYYYVLEYEAKIPKIMTAEHIWLAESSEVEYYKPIILPASQEGG